VAEWFIRVYSNVGDTVFEPFCVCKDSKILLNQQDSINIQDIGMRKDAQIDLFGNYRYIDNVMSVDLEHSNNPDDRDSLIKSSGVENFFVRESDNVNIFEISSRNRRMLMASENHVFLVKVGNGLEWKQLKDIKFGDFVAMFPSIVHLDSNVEKEVTILGEKDIIKNIPDGVNREAVLNDLKSTGLVPLTNKNRKLFILSRLIGFLMTDGSINEGVTKDGYPRTDITFPSGESESLVSVIRDIQLLGFDTDAKPLINRDKKKGCIDRGSCSQVTLSSRSLYVLLKSLGVPLGKKTEQIFDIPSWIYDCSKRDKQEFLGGLMGGDGTVPMFTYKILKSGEKSPVLNGGGFVQSKIKDLESYLSNYISNIVDLLKELNIECVKEYKVNYELRDDGNKSVTYHINFSDSHLNVLNFLRYVGYRYDCQKLRETSKLYEYLISKENRIGINAKLTNKPFYNYWKWEEIYVREDIIFDEVISVKKIEYNDKLYDLRIKNTRNYVVNGFITHNSGRGTTAMQALWTDRNVICNDLSSYSNVLCHSIMYVPYMRDVTKFINILEEYINSNRCNISTDYAGKGSDNDVAKLYHRKTFDKIIKLRNILNSRDVLLGFREDLLGDIGHEYKDDPKMVHTYRHEVVMFTRLVMSQLMLHSSRDMSFNGIKTRGTDNTYIKGILKYYKSLGESPYDVNIFENMRHYVDHMGLDELGVKNKFGRLSRKLISCDARKLDLPDKCADIVVTSPPYTANLNYGMANWLRIWSISGIGDPFVGGHINSEMLEKNDNSEIYGKVYDRITDHAGGTVDNPMSYSGFTGQYLHELYRVLKDDAVAIVVVGDYGNKKKLDAHRIVTDRAVLFGFKPVMIIMDELNKQTKSSTQFQAKHDGGKNDYDVCVVLFKGNYKQKNNPEDLDFRWGAKYVDGSQLDIESAWGDI
jgi:intein/homing endonuclease